MFDTKDYKWYIVHTQNGYEKKIRERIDKRVKENGMEDLIVDIYIPSQMVSVTKNGKKVKDIHKDTVVFNLEDIGNFDFLDSTRKFYHGMTNKGPTHTPEPRRMAKCVKCGAVKSRILFSSYNANNPNMGICSECYLKSKKQ